MKTSPIGSLMGWRAMQRSLLDTRGVVFSLVYGSTPLIEISSM